MKINKFGRLGYVCYDVYSKTSNNEDSNKGLKNKFVELKKHNIYATKTYFRGKI